MSATTAKTVCGRCNGTGRIVGFAHIENGVCFACRGAGTGTMTTLTETRAEILAAVKSEIDFVKTAPAAYDLENAIDNAAHLLARLDDSRAIERAEVAFGKYGPAFARRLAQIRAATAA